jgi:hypothetical protein
MPQPTCFLLQDWLQFMRPYAEILWSIFDQVVKQISMELKQHYRVDGLEDVRVIRDRQTRMNKRSPLRTVKLTLLCRTISSIWIPPIRDLAAGAIIYGTPSPLALSLRGQLFRW